MKKYMYGLLLLLLAGFHTTLYSKEIEYYLSTDSEEYNTRYFYTKLFNSSIHRDSIHFIDVDLPQSFVIEFNALQEGEKMVIIYDDIKSIPIEKKQGKYIIKGRVVKDDNNCKNKISFYFVNNRVVIYLDEIKKKEFYLKYNNKRKIGIKWSRSIQNNYFLICYEPVPFSLADYGSLLDDGNLNQLKKIRLYLHSVGEKYSLTFPSDISWYSKRSLRFEYRYENTLAEGKNQMQRGRSEISGVFGSSPMNKWIIEFDFYVPTETSDDPRYSEIITQLHEGSSMPTSPSFAISMLDGKLFCKVKGDSTNIAQWGKENPIYQITSNSLSITKNEWHHIKVYIKEGFLLSAMPLTRVWVDDNLLLDCKIPNCYYYDPMNSGRYDYIKFGIYKALWLKNEEKNLKLRNRVYYFDNYVVKY